MASSFVPRTVFNVSQDIPRSYFLGHHRSALQRMKEMLKNVDHVIECRDFRAPETSYNPLLDEALGDVNKTIAYTKRDLGGDYKLLMQQKEKKIMRWDRQWKTFFVSREDQYHGLHLFKHLKRQSLAKRNPVTGAHILIVGMPNVGKSVLLSALRRIAKPKGKKAKMLARTGSEPGVTRSVSGAIKLFDQKAGPVYIHDTPGVFMPYVDDAESMLKLALCGIVKDSIVSDITLADYILFHLNQVRPFAYKKFCPPTNEIIPFLEAMALKTSCFGPGRTPDIDRAARKFINLWRAGELPGFIVDDVEGITARKKAEWKAEQEAKKANGQGKEETVEDVQDDSASGSNESESASADGEESSEDPETEPGPKVSVM